MQANMFEMFYAPTCIIESIAETRDRTRDLQIFSLTLSQLSYRGCMFDTNVRSTKLPGGQFLLSTLSFAV